MSEDRFHRFSENVDVSIRLVSKSRYQVVFPVLPMDILGLYILLPATLPTSHAENDESLH